MGAPVNQPYLLADLPPRVRETSATYTTRMLKVTTLREVMVGESLRVCDNPETVEKYYHEVIATDERHNAEVETFCVLHLNTRRRPIGYSVVSNGTLDTILVHPREVFKVAIGANAAAIVLIHNHPSGDPTPSEADIKVTRDLIRAGQLLKIEVLDHCIMGQSNPAGRKGYSSLRELGYFYS